MLPGVVVGVCGWMGRVGLWCGFGWCRGAAAGVGEIAGTLPERCRNSCRAYCRKDSPLPGLRPPLPRARERGRAARWVARSRRNRCRRYCRRYCRGEMRDASADFFRGLRWCRGGVGGDEEAYGIAVFAADSSLWRDDALECGWANVYGHERVLSYRVHQRVMGRCQSCDYCFLAESRDCYPMIVGYVPRSVCAGAHVIIEH